MRKYNLTYYVYVENINRRKIEKYNVLNDGIVEEILKRTKGFDKKAFAAEVDRILRYHFWSRAEWEVILTDWPTHISTDELVRLNNEVDKYEKEYSREPYSMCVNLKTEEKIDVYDQVTMNWNIFIDYLWENLK